MCGVSRRRRRLPSPPAGSSPGDRVAVQVEKSPEALFLYLGAIRAGAVFLPLNTAYTASEVAYFVGDAKPTVFVADPARREALIPCLEASGVAHVETLAADGSGSFAELSMSQRGTTGATPSGRPTTSQRSSTRRARPGARRAPC